ncbi:MAG: DUF2007 domain-containing protein [Clostridia bacterium]|nr:DUF2007 domain-containing protein [Clostridia bacterium]
MDRLFGLDSPALHDEGISLLATLYDDISATMYEEILRDAEIPFLKKDRGAGGAMRIIMGGTLSAIDIYVPTDRLAEAEALFREEESEVVDE